MASRLISGALGIRPPKRTEDQKEYDRVAKEKEKKRKDEARKRGEAEIKAAEARRKAVWED